MSKYYIKILICLITVVFYNCTNNNHTNNESKVISNHNSKDKNQLKKDELLKRINYLDKALCHQNSFNDFSQIMNNREWLLFSYSFTAYSLTNIALTNVEFKESSIKTMKTLINSVLNSDLSFTYGIDSVKLYEKNIPEYSVLYLGHLNLMLSCYRLISEDTSFNDLNDNISLSLYNRYKTSSCLNLESYPNAIWISDNTVALASLNIHSEVTDSKYYHICNEWIDLMKSEYTEENSGVLYSTIDSKTCLPLEEPRGSMLSWDIIFISKFDKEYAMDLYKNYVNYFSDNYIRFRLFKERAGDFSTNPGDIDSGPLIAGYSIPANVFALACASIIGDDKTANQIQTLLKMGTREIEKDNQIYYSVPFLDLEISPMAEAIVLFSLTSCNWTK